jgi:hypothetical protein
MRVGWRWISVLVFLVLVGAVVLPALRRAGVSGGVQGGLGDVRTILSAEEAYASGNGGYYDVPSCLGTPARCIPRGGAAMPSHLDAALAALQPRAGYELRFHPGPPPILKDAEREVVSKSSLTAFAVSALPAEGRGRKAFCGDSGGRVCARADGTMPPIRDGRCPDSCETLR